MADGQTGDRLGRGKLGQRQRKHFLRRDGRRWFDVERRFTLVSLSRLNEANELVLLHEGLQPFDGEHRRVKEIGSQVFDANLRQVLVGAALVANHLARRTTAKNVRGEQSTAESGNALRAEVLSAEVTLFLKRSLRGVRLSPSEVYFASKEMIALLTLLARRDRLRHSSVEESFARCITVDVDRQQQQQQQTGEVERAKKNNLHHRRAQLLTRR